ncbi:hypothetical protein ERJ75_000377600 [Trypanosoma vivax]|nr:hypothetical protein ERJ75_000377600 [Trypanosoma vivax]
MEDASQQCCATWFRGCGMGHGESATWALSGRSDDSEGWGKAVCRDEAEGGGLLTGVKGDENKDVATAGTCRVFDRFFVRIASERAGQGHLEGEADAVCAVITTLRKATLETGRIGSLVGAAVKQSSAARVLVAKRRALEKARAVEHALVETGEPARDADPAVAAAAQKAEKALNALLRVADKMEERVTEVTATQVTKFAQGVANANEPQTYWKCLSLHWGSQHAYSTTAQHKDSRNASTQETQQPN